MARILSLAFSPPRLVLCIGQAEIDPIYQLSQGVPLVHPLFLLVGALEDILLVTRIGRMSLHPPKCAQIETIGIPPSIAILGQVPHRPLLPLVLSGLP